jgi:2-dehydropantoate 2-reductase
MRICIYGAGAIGGWLGGLLHRAGLDVSLVARGPHLAAMREHGLRLIMEDGRELTARPRCTDDPAGLGPQDYVVVCLKAHSIPGVVDAMAPLLGPETAVVTAVNGIPYWYLHRHGGPLEGRPVESVDPGGRQWSRLGPERAIGCVVYPATEIEAPGVIRHVYGRRLPLGEPDGTLSPRVTALAAAFESAGLEVPVLDRIRDELWLKLWGNLCFNPISALTHATLDVIATEPGTRAVSAAMMAEGQAIAERLGVRFRVGIDRRIAGAAKVGAHKTSMLQDLERGRPLEIDPLVTVVQELGRLTGVPTPTLDVVAALVRQRAAVAGLYAPGAAPPAT